MFEDTKLNVRRAKFGIGDVVHHQLFGFYGIVIDVDVKCMKDEAWMAQIPEQIRPKGNQPFYYIWSHPANEQSAGIAYEAEIYLENGRDVRDSNSQVECNAILMHAPPISEVNSFLRTVMN